MANQASTVPFVNSVTSGSNPTNNSYYNIGGQQRLGQRQRPDRTDAINVATQMCQPDHGHDQRARFCHAHEVGDHPLHRLRGPF